MGFLQRDVFEVLQGILPLIELLFISTYFYNITAHHVVPWTENRHFWPHYGFVRWPCEVRAMQGQGGWRCSMCL